jgi:hypothetical protein
LTSNNQAAYLDAWDIEGSATFSLSMPFLGTMHVSIQTTMSNITAVLCPFYKVGMPIGLSCSNPNVILQVFEAVPTASVPCDGVFAIGINTTPIGVTLPITLTLTVGV